MQEDPTILVELSKLLKNASLSTKNAMLQAVNDSISHHLEDVTPTSPLPTEASTPSAHTSFTPTEASSPSTPKTPTEIENIGNFIEHVSENIGNFIEHVSDLGITEEFHKNILSELKSMDLKTKGKGVKTQWLSKTSHSYNYAKVINKPKPINNFPNVCNLLKIVNDHPSSTGDLDCCIVTRFPTNKATLSLHKDSEDIISQTSSICTVSFGAPRALDFVLDGKKKEDGSLDLSPDWTLPATDRTMNVMKPGSQAFMRHMVRDGVGDVLNETLGALMKEDGVRFSVSFRKLVPPSPDPTSSVTQALIPAPTSSPPPPPTSSPPTPPTSSPPPPPPPPPQKKIVLVAGDSFAARLSADLLGKKKKDVRNIALGGRKLSQVQSDITSFISKSPELVIEKLFVSVGTNDIRYCKKGIGHLKRPLSDLMREINRLLPDTKVWFQSLPPVHANGCPYTERNVLSMNVMIYEMCAKFNLFYLDIFGSFIDGYGFRNQALFPNFDQAKKLYDIHPNKKGMGILARFYIFLIHSKWFNPLGY